jgi:protein HOOK3
VTKADDQQLVKAVLLAAMYSEVSNERMINVMQNLGTDVAIPIAQAIGEMEDLDAKLADMSADTETGSDMDHSTDSEAPIVKAPSYERDPELEGEERLIKALQEKRVLENKIAYLSDDLNELREKCSNLEEELAESKFTLDRRRRTTMDEQDLQQLNLQAGRDKDYIAELETDLANATSTIEQQERQMEKLKADDQSKQELKDELQFVKAERDELRQKSKVNENLKKKIQALQEHEKANTGLRKELQSVQEQLQEHEAVKDRCTALEKANEENAQTIANGEQEIFDQKTAKKRMEHELKLITQRFEQARDMLNSAQETIRDLEDRVQDGTTRESSDDINNLDAELAAESGGENAEPRQEKKPKTPTSSAETIVLQQNLSIANASVARLEQRCLDLLQENLGFKSSIEAGEINSEHPFQHQLRKLEALSKELEETQAKYIASTTDIADLKRRLELSEDKGMSASQTKMHLLLILSLANIEKLAKSDEALAQNHDRQIYIEELATQLREHRSLLRHALLSNESLQKEAENIRSSNEYKIVRQQIEAVREAPVDDFEEMITGAATNITEKIESGRLAVSERDKVSPYIEVFRISGQSTYFTTAHRRTINNPGVFDLGT